MRELQILRHRLSCLDSEAGGEEIGGIYTESGSQKKSALAKNPEANLSCIEGARVYGSVMQK